MSVSKARVCPLDGATSPIYGGPLLACFPYLYNLQSTHMHLSLLPPIEAIFLGIFVIILEFITSRNLQSPLMIVRCGSLVAFIYLRIYIFTSLLPLILEKDINIYCLLCIRYISCLDVLTIL